MFMIVHMISFQFLGLGFDLDLIMNGNNEMDTLFYKHIDIQDYGLCNENRVLLRATIVVP